MKPLLLVALTALLLATPGAAQQHQNAFLYTHYDTPAADAYSVDQHVRVNQEAQASFWPLVWKWTGQPFGGYLGLQTDGAGPGGEQLGDTAVFSLWNANAVDPASGSLGGTFGGEGTGYTLRRAFPFQHDRYYRLRVWRLSSEAEGHWWGAWILDTESGVETYLGRIRTNPTESSIDGQSIENFSEYFGPAMPTCGDVPVSVVYWSLPLARTPGGDVVGSFSGSARGSCTGGSSIYYPPFGRPLRWRGSGTAPAPLLPQLEGQPPEHVVVTLGGSL